MDSRGLEGLECLVGREALRDAAQVEDHPGLQERDAAGAGVESEPAVPDRGARALELVLFGPLSRAARAAPEPHGGSDGDVEGAVRGCGDLLGAREDPPEIVAGRDLPSRACALRETR